MEINARIYILKWTVFDFEQIKFHVGECVFVKLNIHVLKESNLNYI